VVVRSVRTSVASGRAGTAGSITLVGIRCSGRFEGSDGVVRADGRGAEPANVWTERGPRRGAGLRVVAVSRVHFDRRGQWGTVVPQCGVRTGSRFARSCPSMHRRTVSRKRSIRPPWQIAARELAQRIGSYSRPVDGRESRLSNRPRLCLAGGGDHIGQRLEDVSSLRRCVKPDRRISIRAGARRWEWVRRCVMRFRRGSATRYALRHTLVVSVHSVNRSRDADGDGGDHTRGESESAPPVPGRCFRNTQVQNGQPDSARRTCRLFSNASTPRPGSCFGIWRCSHARFYFRIAPHSRQTSIPFPSQSFHRNAGRGWGHAVRKRVGPTLRSGRSARGDIFEMQPGRRVRGRYT